MWYTYFPSKPGKKKAEKRSRLDEGASSNEAEEMVEGEEDDNIHPVFPTVNDVCIIICFLYVRTMLINGETVVFLINTLWKCEREDGHGIGMDRTWSFWVVIRHASLTIFRRSN